MRMIHTVELVALVVEMYSFDFPTQTCGC